MIKEDAFRISHKGYAFDLSSVAGEQHERDGKFSYTGFAHAVWYRRKGRNLRACLGTVMLWSHYLPEALDLSDPRAVLSADLDGRYGGDCQGRWNGEGYWGAENPDVMAAHLAVLRPMFNDYPIIPDGYDGWWRFTK
jgi:hypothetical protein